MDPRKDRELQHGAEGDPRISQWEYIYVGSGEGPPEWTPEGFEALGPWFPFTALSTGFGTLFFLRRPLRKVEGTPDAAKEHPAVALLREIEWSGEDNVCPCCGEYGPLSTLDGGPTPGTHRDDCKLAAILAGR